MLKTEDETKFERSEVETEETQTLICRTVRFMGRWLIELTDRSVTATIVRGARCRTHGTWTVSRVAVFR